MPFSALYPIFGVLVLWLLVRRLLKIDWTPGRYKVMFHHGSEVTIKTKMLPGTLVIEGAQITISGPNPFALPLASVHTVDLFRLHGLGRMLRIEHQQGTLFVSVVRFCIAGQFATVDFYKTGKLLAKLGESASAQAFTNPEKART